MIVAETQQNTSYKLPPSGLVLGSLVRILDLGTQKVTWQGAVKMQRKVMFTFELHGDGYAMEDGKPMVQSKRYTLSLNQQSGLRADLESWAGKGLTDDQLKGFNLKDLLGKWAYLNLTHTERDGKTYCNIMGLNPVPSSVAKAGFPDIANPFVYLNLQEYDKAVFESLSDGLKKVIMESAEWQNCNGGAIATNEELNDIPF
jgi:hypothetical protein